VAGDPDDSTPSTRLEDAADERQPSDNAEVELGGITGTGSLLLRSLGGRGRRAPEERQRRSRAKRPVRQYDKGAGWERHRRGG
jgi:hypothetical protein